MEDEPGFGITRYRTEWVDGGPDLTKAAEFFGWDEARTEKLGVCIMRYAAGLRDVEQASEQADYLGEGRMVFRFPGAEGEKRRMLEQLRDEMAEAIGRRDAERLWEFSGMGDLWGRMEMSASISVSGEFASVKMSGGGEVIFSIDEPPADLLEEIIPRHLDEWLRVSHLKNRVDWGRLLEEAIANRTE
ncbi:MAG: hypothetical protein KDN05_12115 [Verrucomicrobiae bacterium]|nr:hypothetical protein [Verrucomicrobiae bacterium]